MAVTRGRCTNTDYCTLAAGRCDIEVRIGQSFVCPECARPLQPPPVKDGFGGVGLVLAGLVVVTALIAGGVYAGYRLAGRTSPVTLASGGGRNAPAPMSAPVPVSAIAPPRPTPPVAAPKPAPAPPPVTREPATLLRLAGGGALATTLAPRLAAAYLAAIGHTGIATGPMQASGQVLVTGQRLSRPEAIAITVQDDAACIAALGAGAADVAIISRRVSQRELDHTRAPDLAAPAAEHAVALEGWAVAVNPRNPRTRLSTPQLRLILDGTIANWSALGGADRPIHLLAEAGAPGLSDLVQGAPDASPGATPVEDVAAAVMADPDALAVLPSGLAGGTKILAVAVVGGGYEMPTPQAIASDAYKLVRRLYLYAPSGSTNPFVQRFAAFTLSPEGQAAVAQAGLVPVVAAPAPPPVPQTPKELYRQLVTGSARLTADLHFETGSNELDLHSAREVDRVWNTMISNHTPPERLLLLGFADNFGPPAANTALAQKRAQAVADVFTRRGLPPGKIVSFGQDLPIADNATEAGREKNRRVEVFLRP